MKDVKYEQQSTFPLWGWSNLILGTVRENKIFFSEKSSRQFVSQNCKKLQSVTLLKFVIVHKSNHP